MNICFMFSIILSLSTPLYVVWVNWIQLSAMSLLLTVWDDGGELAADVFLGEVLLDLASADVRGSIVWYDLQEHDLNCISSPASTSEQQ